MKKFVFMAKILYQCPLLSTGSVSLKIEIFMSEILLALRLIKIDTNHIVEKKKGENRYNSSRQIAKKLNIHHSTLAEIGNKKTSILHKKFIGLNLLFLQRDEIQSFLKCMITGDKNESSTIILTGNGCSPNKGNFHIRSQRPDCSQKK